jgi:hypothetical protein
MLTGFIGLFIFIGDIFAIISLAKSSATSGQKVLWCLLIIIFPVIGFIIWYVAGPKKRW